MKEHNDPYGFIDKYKSKLTEFYKPYFKSDNEFDDFISVAFNYSEKYYSARNMIYQVERFISLANDIDKIRPGRDSLRIVFIKTCIESIRYLSGYNKNNKKAFYDSFPNYLTNEGKKYILSNFSLSYFEEIYQEQRFEASYDLTIADFFEIIKATRDTVVHDGDYWSMQFFAYDTDSEWLTSLETEYKILKSYEYKCNDKMKRTYHFSTTLQYDKFIFYFVEACIKYINDYISRKETEKGNE